MMLFRTGYLLDAFAIPNPVDTFTCLINQLRMVNKISSLMLPNLTPVILIAQA